MRKVTIKKSYNYFNFLSKRAIFIFNIEKRLFFIVTQQCISHFSINIKKYRKHENC